MLRQTPSGPTFTQTPLFCEPEDEPEPEPDGVGAAAGAVLAAGAGAEVAGVLGWGVTWLGFEPPLRVVPPLPVPLVPPLPELPLPDPAPVPPPRPAAAGAGVVPDEPWPGWVSCRGSDPPPRPPGSACDPVPPGSARFPAPGLPGPPWPAAWPCGPSPVAIGLAEAAGEIPAADGSAGPRCRTWIETVEKSRNAIAPPDSTMIGTVLPAGCSRRTAPARPMPVLIRSVNSAKASCAAGSREI